MLPYGPQTSPPTPQFNAEPPTQIIRPTHTLAPLTRTSASPVPSPPSFCSPSLSCPDRLLAWRGWRRSPMEALVNFHIHKRTKPEEGWGWFRYASCRLNFFSSMCLFTFPLISCTIHSPFPPSQITTFPFSVIFKKAKDLSHLQESPTFLMAASWGKGSAERGREISVLMILCGAGLFLFY